MAGEGLSTEQKYCIKDGFILREVAGEAIIVPNDPDSEIQNSIMEPNETAVFLWRVFMQPSSIEDVTQKVLEEYEVEAEHAKASVVNFVRELLQYRILSEVD